VILWGAYVRATGSGAGCGSHWPLCNGVVVPRTTAVETAIEFTHRTSSGLALVAVVGLLIWARRAYAAGHPVRRGASISSALIVVEALLGAGLVLFELVADDASSLRAVAMVAHLINTFLLIGALALTAWWASRGPTTGLAQKPATTRILILALLGMLFVGGTGAIAALGDTLFPAETLGDGLRDSFSRDSHPLIQLRKYHPLLAVLIGIYVVGAARHLAKGVATGPLRQLVNLLTGAYILQLLVGVVNIVLLAPVPMQLIHLFLADVVWIALVLFMAAAPSETAASIRGVGREDLASARAPL
jgi:heme A synthase